MTKNILRKKGLNALSTIIKDEKNLSIIEKAIYDGSNGPDKNNTYKNNIYQVIGDLIKGVTITDSVKLIKTGKLGWLHPDFKNLQIRMDEQDNFIENPFEVAEGILECRKCGSKRVWSYAKQCRGCDEPTTTFASCCACGTKWRYDG